jgi:hypothetical protein
VALHQALPLLDWKSVFIPPPKELEQIGQTMLLLS